MAQGHMRFWRVLLGTLGALYQLPRKAALTVTWIVVLTAAVVTFAGAAFAGWEGALGVWRTVGVFLGKHPVASSLALLLLSSFAYAYDLRGKVDAFEREPEIDPRLERLRETPGFTPAIPVDLQARMPFDHRLKMIGEAGQHRLAGHFRCRVEIVPPSISVVCSEPIYSASCFVDREEKPKAIEAKKVEHWQNRAVLAFPAGTLQAGIRFRLVILSPSPVRLVSVLVSTPPSAGPSGSTAAW